MIIKQKGFLIAFLVFIGFVSIAYYVDERKSSALSPDECASLGKVCGHSAFGAARGMVNESDAQARALALCEARLKIAKEERDQCKSDFKKKIELCENKEGCGVYGLEERDNLDTGKCKLDESLGGTAPCWKITDNKDGTVTECDYFYNPPRTDCRPPRKQTADDRLGWACFAISEGSCLYQFECMPTKETEEVI